MYSKVCRVSLLLIWNLLHVLYGGYYVLLNSQCSDESLNKCKRNETAAFQNVLLAVDFVCEAKPFVLRVHDTEI